jgi:hypothetical protein
MSNKEQILAMVNHLINDDEESAAKVFSNISYEVSRKQISDISKEHVEDEIDESNTAGDDQNED